MSWMNLDTALQRFNAAFYPVLRFPYTNLFGKRLCAHHLRKPGTARICSNETLTS